MRRYVLSLFLFLLCIGLLYLLSDYVGLDLDKLLNVVISIPPIMFFVWFLLSIMEYLLHCERFKIISGSSMHLGNVAIYYNIGHLISFISPARAIGELARTFVFHKYLKISKMHAFSSIVLERILDIMILAFASLGILILVSSYLPVIALVFLGIFLFIFLTNHVLHSFILDIIPIKQIRELLKTYFLHSQKLVSDKKRFSILIVISLLSWTLNFIRYWLILSYFSIDVPFLLSVGITSLSYFAVIFSVFPGGLVFFEGAGTGILSLMGYSAAQVLGAIFVERIFSYWFWIFTGIIAFALKGVISR